MKIIFQQYESDRLYPLGYKFDLKRGRQDVKKCTVLNYLITHNANGNVTDFKYLVAYDFCGQRMTMETVQTTIDMATNNGWQHLEKTVDTQYYVIWYKGKERKQTRAYESIEQAEFMRDSIVKDGYGKAKIMKIQKELNHG